MNKNAQQIRRQHNLDLIRRMRAGDALTSFDSKASWFPPRPIIQKDAKEMSRLYRSDARPTPRVLTAEEQLGSDTRPADQHAVVKTFPTLDPSAASGLGEAG